jgi:hypothetical protein
MTSSEWLIFNILDLRFVQGYKIRDVVRRLAVSESDYYRKQRVAIEQVAETLVQMERDADEDPQRVSRDATDELVDARRTIAE